MDPSDWIRISCAVLCRIRHPSLGFFLLLNQNRREKGVYVLSPIGGALEYTDEAIIQRFEALPEDPTNADLRLMLPLEHLPTFRTWFYSEQGREVSPFRELCEELVVESKLVPELKPGDVTSKRLWTVERERFTERRGQTGLLTHYFLEIYEVSFTREAVWGQLIAAPRDHGAMWLREEQLASEAPIVMDIDGEERSVRVNGRILLEPPDQASATPAGSSGTA